MVKIVQYEKQSNGQRCDSSRFSTPPPLRQIKLFPFFENRFFFEISYLQDRAYSPALLLAASSKTVKQNCQPNGCTLSNNIPTVKNHPSISTNNKSLNGIEMTIGDNIIMPILVKIDATTMSITKNGK